MDKVLVIAGPTGTGKSALAVQAAKVLNGEIISGDSMQVYRGMDIGTAKIKPEEMQGIPHHLIDIQTYTSPYHVKAFQEKCRQWIEDITARGKLPIIAGGTGLYLKAALYDYVFTEQEADPALEKRMEALSNAQLHQWLQTVDPESAEKIHPNNRKRIKRALVLAHTGMTKSEQEKQQQHKPLYDVLWIGLYAADNEANLKSRIGRMQKEGLRDEVVRLFSDPETWNCTSFQGIGYKEWKPWLLGQCSEEDVLEQILIHTRQYAKRQMTWFRHQLPVQWFRPEQTTEIMEEIQTWIQTKEAGC